MSTKQHANHLRKGRVSQPGQIYLITACTVSREPVFASFDPAAAACATFAPSARRGGFVLLAWVLMPDHAHWIIQLGARESLSRSVARLKAQSARRTNQVTGAGASVWQAAFHDYAVRRDDEVRSVARYVVANPLRAGLAANLGDYPFWNAVWV